jgi:hypothetical protein
LLLEKIRLTIQVCLKKGIALTGLKACHGDGQQVAGTSELIRLTMRAVAGVELVFGVTDVTGAEIGLGLVQLLVRGGFG